MLTKTSFRLTHSIDYSGYAKYSFDSSSDEVCRLTHFSNHKHHGIVSSRPITLSPTALNGNNIIFTDRTCFFIPSGRLSDRVCRGCGAVIGRGMKAKARDDCPSLHFCSLGCMSKSSNLIDGVVKVLGVGCKNIPNSLSKRCEDIELAVVCLLEASSSMTKSLELTRILNLWTNASADEGCDDGADDVECNDLGCAGYIYNTMNVRSRETLDEIKAFVGLSVDMLVVVQLLRVIKYNMQAVPVLDLPGTNILCLFSTMARINHSCSPNSVIVLSPPSSLSSESEHTIKIELRAIRSIQIGEEICTSYLKPLCSDITSRRDILRAAFHFTCICDRCNREAFENSRVHSDDSKDSKLVHRLQAFLSKFDASDQTHTRSSLLDLEGIIEAAQRLQHSSSKLNHIYLIHDVGIAVYGNITNKLVAEDDISDSLKLTLLTVRVCSIISDCLRTVGVENTLQAIEFATKGSSEGVKALVSLQSNSGGDKQPQYMQIYELGNRMAINAARGMSLLYPNSKQSELLDLIVQQYVALKP